MNFPILFASALIPIVIGAIWYNPKVLGSAWMKASGVTEEQVQTGNMIVIFGLAFLFSFFLAVGLSGLVVHQTGVFQLFGSDPSFAEAGSEYRVFVDNFMEKYGDRHRSFGHGALHGGLAAIMFALPLIGIIALFERRGWKYTMIHFLYWFIALILMGGVICQFS